MANLNTKTEIKSILKSILEEKGYTGEILDILVDLSTETVYLTQLSASIVLREGNVQTATKLESMLAISHECFTRVFRGTCQRLEITDLQCIKTIETKAFQLLQTKSPHKIFYSEDGNFNANDTGINLTLIVGSDIESYDNEGDVDTRLYSDSHILDVPGSNWSEDFLLFRNDQKIYNVEDIPVDLQTDEKYYGNMYTKEAKRVSDIIPYYIATTAPSYGIRIYNYNSFSLADKYTFKGIKLMDANQPDLNPSQLNNIEGFVYKDSKLSIKNIASVREESSITVLKNNILSGYRDRNYISSKNGIISAIKKYLADVFLGFTVNVINNTIVVTYILNEGKEWNETVKKQFTDYALFNYKITEPIEFEEAETIYVRLFLKIYYNNVINQMEVLSLIDSFENNIGGTYKIDKLKSTISKLETVDHVEIIPKSEVEYANMRSGASGENGNDMEVALEYDEEIPVEDEEEGETTTVHVIKRLKFDTENKTGNSLPDGITSNKLITFASQNTDVL